MQELATVVETAGDWLSAGERQEAQFWIRKITRVPKEARERPTQRELPPDVLESAAAAVRGALKKAARERTTTNWARLRQQLGSALPHMTLADRVQVLTLVDRATPAHQALLSSLVAAGDPDMTTVYREVATRWGWTCLRTTTTYVTSSTLTYSKSTATGIIGSFTSFMRMGGVH